jgi:hypothetical protein
MVINDISLDVFRVTGTFFFGRFVGNISSSVVLPLELSSLAEKNVFVIRMNSISTYTSMQYEILFD